jgi:hypothetical protein
MRSIDRRALLPAAGAVLLADLFLSWQQACFDTGAGSVCAARSGWHGIGVLAGLLAIALVAWEVLRTTGRAPAVPTSPQVVSAALALATAAVGVITFLSHDEARHWPAWLGLLLVLLIAFGGWQRRRDARDR